MKIKKINFHIELDNIIALLFFSLGALHLSLCGLLLFFEDLAGDFASIFLSYDDFAAIGISFLLLGLSTKYIVKARRQDLIDNNLPNLLRDISEAGISGVTIPRAIELSTEKNYGPLTKELRKLIAQIRWKVPLSDALKAFGQNCGTVFSKKVALLVDAAVVSGGNVQESIEIVNNFVQEFQSQQRRRKSELKPHLIVVYISFLIFIAVGIILITQFFNMEPPSTSLPSNLAAISTNFLNPNTLDFTRLFYRISLVEGLFSGLVAGKMSAGTIQAGFIHSAILCIISFFAFNFLI